MSKFTRSLNYRYEGETIFQKEKEKSAERFYIDVSILGAFQFRADLKLD